MIRELEEDRSNLWIRHITIVILEGRKSEGKEVLILLDTLVRPDDLVFGILDSRCHDVIRRFERLGLGGKKNRGDQDIVVGIYKRIILSTENLGQGFKAGAWKAIRGDIRVHENIYFRIREAIIDKVMVCQVIDSNMGELVIFAEKSVQLVSLVVFPGRYGGIGIATDKDKRVWVLLTDKVNGVL